mmetsp:Transcript_13170/g.37036  ORF Transcript_13170/g.37036 Transcript_13170/m.37036 type:complete len:702 (+) Transcript_13170:270-2375(+)
MVSSRTSTISGLEGSVHRGNFAPTGNSNDDEFLVLDETDDLVADDDGFADGSCESDFLELELKIPGPFVVLQGNTGDGLSNTMDGILPVLAPARRIPRTTTVTATANAVPQPPPPAEDFHHVPTNAAAGIVNGPRFAVTAGAVAAAAAAENMEQNSTSREDTPAVDGNTNGMQSTSPPSEEFVVVTETSGTQTNENDDDDHEVNENDRAAIAEWEALRRQSELQQLRDWEDSLYQVPPDIVLGHVMMTRSPVNQATNDPEGNRWWQRNGEVAVLRELPTKLFDGSVAVSRIGTLPPGSTVWAMDLVELRSATMLPIQRSETAAASSLNASRSVAPARCGVIQLIQLETKEGRRGYACLSLDGYPLLGPGLQHVYVDPSVSRNNTAARASNVSSSWIWRVTCPSGAFVREGLDLNTRHTRTLPYGSLIRIGRRCINNQGLSRLRTSGRVAAPNDSDDHNPLERVEGWCSELLNPLSGQRGIVAQPLPFPVPAVYRVTLPMGAVVRRDVELSSPQTGLVPFDNLVKVVGRAFSEHPVDKCIERLRLAGNGGWISVRLNLPPPQDDLVVELVDIDCDFDPENPGLYHLNAQRAVRAEREGESSSQSDLSSVDETELSQDIELHNNEDRGDSNCIQAKGVPTPNHSMDTFKCVVCLTSERNATIIHGETGHVVCCLVCARILKARGDKCPVCRLDIDLVIQHFYA